MYHMFNPCWSDRVSLHVHRITTHQATDAGDLAALQAVAERALTLMETNRRAQSGVADISVEVGLIFA